MSILQTNGAMKKTPLIGSRFFFPKQFTVGVLNAILDLAALVLVGVAAFLGSEMVVSLHVGGGSWLV